MITRSRPWLALASCAAILLHAMAAAASDAAPYIERLDAGIDRLIASGAVIEVVAEGIAWAEGPLWDPRSNSLLFSDVPANAIYRYRNGQGIALFLTASGYSGAAPFTGKEPGSNGLAFDAEGRLLYCQHGDRGIGRLEPDGRRTVLVDRYQGKRLNSPNDLVVHSNGDIYFTDPPFGLPGTFADPSRELDFQGVFLLRSSGELIAVARDLGSPNGIALSADERTLYVANAARELPVWTSYPVLPDGTLGPGQLFADARDYVSPGDGLPDGIKVDHLGNVFAAGPGGVHVFTADGRRIGRIVTGAPTGNLGWGEDGSVLYIAANNRLLRLQTTTRAAPGQFRRG